MWHGIRVASANKFTRRWLWCGCRGCSVRRCGRRQPGSNRPVTSSSCGRGTFASLDRASSLYLPLAWQAMMHIEQILREELTAIGGVEVSLPVVHPAELWQQSGRYQKIGAELTRFLDRRERDMVLAMTHEEVVASLAASEISSYRQLPKLVFQIQIKWRDDPRP